MRFGRGSRYASFPVQLVCLVGLISLQALGTPLQPTLSSCIGSYDAASTEVRLNVTSAYANIVNGEEASRQGLIGGGNDVLRVDLVGLVGQEIAGYDNETNKLATLFSDTTTAHLSVYSSTTWLCNSIFPSELPYPYYPFNTTYCPLQPGDFALNLSIPLYRSYALTTLRTRVRIVDTSLEARTLACYDLEFTPYKDDGWYYRLFLWLPVTLAIGFWITTWAARFAAGWVVGSGVAEYGTKEGIHGSRANIAPGAKREARMRKWGTMIVSGLSGERLSVSGGLLRFVTPGLRDIIQHIQFCTMLGMIAVSWPTFTYPILAKGAWSDLVWNVTLIQGSDPTSKRVSDYPNNYTAPAQFSNMINDPYYPLYLNQNAFNPLIDLHGASDGMESFARAVGLRKQDLFGTCLVVFLLITLAVIILSLFLWTVHGIMEYVSPPVSKRPAAVSQRSSMLYGSSQASLGMKDAYEPKRHSWGAGPSNGPGTLPTQASLNAGMASGRAVSKTRKTWLRFRPKGEAGAFHAAALYGNLLRLILMFHLPITTFSIYQLTLSSATIVSRVFAALAFVFISVLIPAGVLFKVNKTPSGKLYDATRTLLSLGPMYNVYVVQKQMYRVFPLAASLITGIVVGAGQKNGLAQAVILILVELTMLIVLAVWYPWGDGAGMGAPGAFLGMIRVCSAVLVMLLAPQLGMVHSTNAWIAYAVLLLQAIAFVFFLFMLLTKIIEGLIRLFGGAHFDESTSPLDGGIFAAIMDLDCLNGVRGGKAAQRKRRKRGSRQLQRNVSAVGSLTTQMMLDRHSQGVQRQPISQSTTPHLTPYSAYQVNEHGVTNQSDGYFAGYNQPPLGPAPLERHSSDSRSDEPSHSGHIMDAWKAPSGSKAYAAPGLYVPSAQSPSAEAGPSRSFSVIRGGRAEYKNPYEMNDEVAGRSLSPPPGTRVAPATKPVHNRQQSSHGIIEGESPPIIYTDSSPPATVPTLYPPGHTGPRPNNQGLRPPALAIPKRRSLNNLKDDASPDSLNSSSAAEAVKGKKGKRRSKPSTWFAKHNNDSASSPVEDDYTDETDDEPGPSRKRKAGSRPHRPPKPFEPVPSPLLEDERAGGIRGLLGLKRKKSLNDVEERARNENKARKAALAAQSGSLFAGVDAPVSPTAGRGFVVNRKKADSTTLTGTDIKGTRGNPIIQPMPVESPATSQTPDEGSRSFKVKRMGRQTPSPTLAPISVPAPTALIPGSSSSANSHSQSGHSSLIATPEPSPKPGAGFSHTASGAKSTLSAGTYPMTALKSTGTVPLSTGEDNKPPTRTFRVLGRQGGSPTTSTQSLGPVRPTNSRNASSSSFVVNRSQRSSMDTPPLPTTGYAPSDFVPIHSGRRG